MSPATKIRVRTSLQRSDARLYAMAEDIKRNFGEALAEANQDMERRLDSLDKRLAELERKANS